MRILSVSERANKKCHFCDTTLSVRYAVEVFDPVVSENPVEVCACNRCVLLHMNEEKTYE